MTHGEALRALRDELGLTRREFGERVGMTREEVSIMENGLRGMPDKLSRWKKLADGLGVSIDRVTQYMGGEIKVSTLLRDAKVAK